MKVLMINGSPNEKSCTYTALAEAASSLELAGVATEIAWIGKDPIRGCQSCGGCKGGTARCVFDDIVNDLLEKAKDADGFIIGSPVYYAGANGALLCVLDRMFFAGSSVMAFKPGAGIASARRAGTVLAIDQINKYFQINQMPLVSSNYWPMVHGKCVEDVMQDKEGLQIMRVLGTNMAWMLKSLEAAKQAGLALPEPEAKVFTNFIR